MPTASFLSISRIIITFNRLPAKAQYQADGLHFQPSEGGLATGLSSIYRADGDVWVGWPGLSVEDSAEQAQVTERLAANSMAPVFLTESEFAIFTKLQQRYALAYLSLLQRICHSRARALAGLSDGEREVL